MTKKELHDSIVGCITLSDPPYPTVKIAKLVDAIWGQPFDGETKKIKPATEESSTTLSESFPDGTTYTDRRDSETPTQPQ